jgi:hypothetical protein
MTEGHYYGTPLGNFAPGQRVEFHPATDLWMRGARYGTVRKAGRKRVHVEVDRLGRVLRVSPDLIRIVR